MSQIHESESPEWHAAHRDAASLASKLLSTLQPSRTLLADTAAYDSARHEYWSREQINARPACFFRPESAPDVSLALIVLQHAQCPFAVKSGGHGRSVGESSINTGVTIDLKNLNHINVSEDRTSVEIGPGNRWIDVYSALDPLGVTVVGGRAGNVGVGGFLLGGGISFLTNKYGLATDNVEAFEIVLADGQIKSASPSSNPDLYKALRGGGANLGIVTSFKLTLYPQGSMWGGPRAYGLEHRESLLSAFWDYGYDNKHNSDMGWIFSLVNYEDEWVWAADLIYLLPEIPVGKPIFKDILEIPAAFDQTSIATQSQRVTEMASLFVNGRNNAFWTLCTNVDKRIVRFYFDTWRDETKDLLSGSAKFLHAECQFITANVTKAMERNGGNATGLVGQEPFLVFLMEPWWEDDRDTPAIERAMKNTAQKVQTEAQRLGVQHDYLYVNYSGPYQDPFSGYGTEAKDELRRTAAKYDPNGVFQKLRRSGFNLHGPLRAL
ncbi:hypothetical protein NW759_015784 [Fusarium solani]|nr:hypothetical protein NW759_015784 [Fusarium solani]